MAKQKKPVHRVQMTEGKRNIIHQLLEEYDIQTAEDIPDALKDLLGGTIKEMMEAEMEDHLGYEKSERSDNDDYRNGYKRKRINSSYGANVKHFFTLLGKMFFTPYGKEFFTYADCQPKRPPVPYLAASL